VGLFPRWQSCFVFIYFQDLIPNVTVAEVALLFHIHEVPGGYFGPEFGVLSGIYVSFTPFKQATNYQPTNQPTTQSSIHPTKEAAKKRNKQLTK
jgi:hypothetical protein